jgi:hypothetical protein
MSDPIPANQRGFLIFGKQKNTKQCFFVDIEMIVKIFLFSMQFGCGAGVVSE